MQDVIVGKYRLSKTENFDAFLAEIGKFLLVPSHSSSLP